MDLQQIRELLRIVAESGVAEVEIEEDDFRLVVRKSAMGVTMQAPTPFAAYPPPYAPSFAPSYAMPPASMQPGGMAAPGHGPGGAATAGTPPPEAPVPSAPPVNNSTPGTAQTAEDVSEEGTVVHAPIVGTFYRAPAPDADPFVKEGDRVKPGDVLCIIEAMKLMNEIECEDSGVIRKILVQNAEPVEYDQPLFVIDAD